MRNSRTMSSFTTLNLPTSLVKELKVWRMAFNASYGRTASYGQMIRGMLDSLEDSEPSVHEEFCKIVERHPEIMETITQEG